MFYTPIRTKVENVENYVLACLISHNYLRLTDNPSYCHNGFPDSYYATGNLQQREWRGFVSENQGSVPKSRVKGSRYSNQAIKMRNAIEDFVNSEEGSISWQEALHKKPYFPGPGILWEGKKDQVNIIFPSTFWLKKDCISYQQKVQNKNFSVISKYHLSINFLAQNKTVFPIPEKFKKKLFSNQ